MEAFHLLDDSKQMLTDNPSDNLASQSTTNNNNPSQAQSDAKSSS